MITCPHCHASITAPNARFCPACGRALPRAQFPGVVTGMLRTGSARNVSGLITIGRDPSSTIFLDSPLVSFRHAVIDARQAPPILSDTSRNGTYVNGQRVSRTPLRPGDVIQIASFRLSYDQLGLTQALVQVGHRLDGIGLKRTVKIKGKPRVILNDVTVCVYPGEFVGVVGGSGSGKSTLIKALTGFERADAGMVRLDGEDLYKQFNRFRSQFGYVPQEDIVHRDLTVRRVLYYAARLRLPADMKAADIDQRIDHVLHQLNLSAQKDTLVERLSGGQRKRVNIAVEMLADPKVFFLDEPTSGLDPGLDRKLMTNLRQLANSGRTVMVVTHATESIEECNLIAFMAEGRLVYFGPPRSALQHFNVVRLSNSSPVVKFSDIYNLLESDNPQEKRRLAEEYERLFRQSDDYRVYVATRTNTAPAPLAAPPTAGQKKDSLIRQFGVLGQRYAELVLRDRILLALLLLVMPFVGLLLGLIAEDNALTRPRFYHDAEQLAFMMSFSVMLLGVFAAAFEIAKETAIFKRERMVNLRLRSYVASKASVLGAFALPQCAMLLGALAVSGIGLPSVPRLFATLVAGAVTSIMLGLLISALAPNTNTVIYFVLAIVIVQVVFGGTIFALPDAMKPVATLTVVRWTMQAIGSIVDIKGMRTPPLFDPEDPKNGWRLDYNSDASAIIQMWLVLMLFAVVYSAVILVLQRRKARLM